MTPQPSPNPVHYTTYSLSSIVTYYLVTILHFLLGGIGIIIGYQASNTALGFGLFYLLFAFGQMVGIMPWRVCPNCIYVNLGKAQAKPGLNPLSRRLAKMGDPAFFSSRSQAILRHNNLYMAALLIPVFGLIPALIANFSAPVLLVWLAVTGLLLFRFFVVFGKVDCLHCKAKKECPKSKAASAQ